MMNRLLKNEIIEMSDKIDRMEDLILHIHKDLKKLGAPKK